MCLCVYVCVSGVGGWVAGFVSMLLVFVYVCLQRDVALCTACSKSEFLEAYKSC